ncbi:terminase large subunit [Arsenicicoccus sp. MKL-02]|uniref:Terminase large subunit n=1 Tax=Arsenicicoccus cauae TaxID=2663847 RepID=A0A6I3IMC7_9MICO|nr:terminase large subunit [Arsenicicoccus cauae]MTB72795.1 terminase large subunit [Arsenicicoccus cauae]
MSGTKAGPKAQVTAEPLDLTGWPRARAARRLRFIRDYILTPKGEGALKPFKVRPWQREIVTGAFAPGIRTALVSLPRANGKTALAAALAVAELFVGPPSAEVLVVASDQRQANIALRMAKRMIELNPDLAERAMIYADRIVVPENDATMMALPADPGALHGWDPSLLVVDELHVVTEPVWEAVTSMSGKRPESLTLAISTPSTSPDCVMFRLVEHGREGTDPAFFLREFAAPDGCATDDRAAWKIGNPALGDFLAEDGLEAARRTLREPVFRQLRLGQWVSGSEAWLPFGAWDACAAPDLGTPPDGSKVVLAFDGSASGDSTALVGCTVGPDPHLFVAGLWENPGDRGWRVPREDVDNAVALAFDRWDVVELAADPWGWRSEIEAWATRQGERRVIEWNTAAAQRMAPATDRLYQAVVTQAVTHDGDPRLAAHVAHAVAKPTTLGDLIVKDKRNSPRKIDAAVASIVALDRAAFHTNNQPRRRAASFR